MQRLRVRIRGIVQGVGFRPFLFRLAGEFGLTGNVCNDGEGVTLEIQGERAGEFLHEFPRRIPVNARIDSLACEEILLQPGELDFRIVESGSTSKKRHGSALVTPDLTLCEDCRRELYEPENRRYLYPFLNCTACGPRFTIVRTVPYSRENTSMHAFPLCDECAREYGDPADRRFHAEPVACHRCGPRIHLIEADGAVSNGCDELFRESRLNEPDSLESLQQRTRTILGRAADLLTSGRILAVKGLGGWHLAVDATNETAVLRLRERKARDDKPFAVMFKNTSELNRYATASEEEMRFMASAASPVVLLQGQSKHGANRGARGNIAGAVAPDGMFLGAMLPTTPLHDLLLHFAQRPLVMTSGNRSGNPTAFRDRDAIEELKGVADAFLIHEREIVTRCDDSVVRIEWAREDAAEARSPSDDRADVATSARTVFYRRSRGYAPDRIASPFPFRRTVFAAGAYLNNAFAFGTGRGILPGHHIGDLDHPSTVEAFREGIQHYERLFDLEVASFVADLHPDYPSTNMAAEMARRRGVPFRQAQHHEAHIASCLAENAHDGPALGLALDGTGFGRDGNLWGGELFRVPEGLLGNRTPGRDMIRMGGLLPLAMPGGEAAVREPWRMGISLLSRAFPGAAPSELLREIQRIQPLENVSLSMKEAAVRGLARGVLTSGCGRLFDAVSSLCGGPLRSSYEGHPAVSLEALLFGHNDREQGVCSREKPYDPALTAGRRHEVGEAYRWDLKHLNEGWILDPAPLAVELLADLQEGRPPSGMALKFHRGLVIALLDLLERAAGESGIRTVALSGGCLFNCYLSINLESGLRERGFRVLRHRNFPTGDGGIAFGQLFLSGEVETERNG